MYVELDLSMQDIVLILLMIFNIIIVSGVIKMKGGEKK